MIEIQIDKSAGRNLKKLPKETRILIEKVIDNVHQSDNLEHEKLSGTKDRYKIRSGNYRIVYKKVAPTHILITAISHRKDIYNKLFGITLSI